MKTVLIAIALMLSPAALHAEGIEAHRGFARATFPNAPTAGGYIEVENLTDRDDRLIGVMADFAAATQIHEMTHSGDVMRMRQITGGLPVPAGQGVDLSPGGTHLMFVGLSRPLVQGRPEMITLVFEHAGKIEVPMQVLAPNARSFDDDGTDARAPVATGGHSH